MFSKGDLSTLRVVKTLFNGVKNRKQSFIGARFDSNMLAESIPITTLVENVEIDTKKELFSGTIYFRPVARQVETLKLFRESAEHIGLGQFEDISTEMPLARTSFRDDLVTADSAMSNIQEIPYQVIFSGAIVYRNVVTIKGQKYTQVTLTEQPDSTTGITQSLTLLFKTFEYDSETLLGTLSGGDGYTKTEMFKVFQLLANGSLAQQVIGSVSQISQVASSTMHPVFSDFQLVFTGENELTKLIIKSDTGLVSIPESKLRRLEIRKTGFSYRVVIQLPYNESIVILLG